MTVTSLPEVVTDQLLGLQKETSLLDFVAQSSIAMTLSDEAFREGAADACADPFRRRPRTVPPVADAADAFQADTSETDPPAGGTSQTGRPKIGTFQTGRPETGTF
jgi:hypothetical protein